MMGAAKKIVVSLAAFLLLGGGGYLAYRYFAGGRGEPAPTYSDPVFIPQEILDNKFGFLGYPEAHTEITKRGGRWVRPHPGPFLWERMQESSRASVSFDETDEEVAIYQDAEIGILATLWPFADWDQKKRPDASQCKVSAEDEFLPGKKEEKGSIDYLPWYRCNPYGWDAYANWIGRVVERYDGDGYNDMPGLEIPIRYWEVMNEPDLGGGERLDFYNEDAAAYAELLIKTAAAIRGADSEASVLIAGAASGSDQFLDFYREVFENEEAIDAFDIGNVHCISNDNYQSFNVEPYLELLAEFEIEKSVWVTEAQAFVSGDPDVNATQVLHSTQKALALGAERIFFTDYEFVSYRDVPKPPGGQAEMPEAELDGDNAVAAYRMITGQ